VPLAQGFVTEEEWRRAATEINQLFKAQYHLRMRVAGIFFVALIPAIIVGNLFSIYALAAAVCVVWLAILYHFYRNFAEKRQNLVEQLNAQIFRNVLVSLTYPTWRVIDVNFDRALLDSNRAASAAPVSGSFPLQSVQRRAQKRYLWRLWRVCRCQWQSLRQRRVGSSHRCILPSRACLRRWTEQLPSR
jgi:hypothetical protein